MSRLWTKCVLGLAAFAAVTFVGQRAEAAYINFYDGCLAGSASAVNCNDGRDGLADGTLTTSVDWQVNYLDWTVDFDDVTSLWRYTYSFFDATAGSQNASHSIIELSASFTAANLKGGTCSEAEIDTFDPNQGGANPGLPDDFYGVKCNGTQANPYTVVLITDRAPVWGDWYAKDGSGSDGNPVYGYNTGFLLADPNVPAGDGSILNHVLVPDTVTGNPQCTNPLGCDVTAPEPVSLALFGLMLTAAGYVGRRRFNS